ncbi:prepilin-type N-terminal cleavage/methylation domain-containing protein [Hafnia alvei]
MQQTTIPHLIAHHQSGFTLIELMVIINNELLLYFFLLIY